MRLMLAAVLAVCFSCTTHAAEGTSANAPAVPIIAEQPDAGALEAATRLAALLNPTDLIVAAEMRGFDEQLIPGFRRQKDFMQLEARHPGLIDAIARELRPQLKEFAIAEAPATHRRIGLFLAQRFS